MNEKLQLQIRNIVQSIPKGCIFDSHFVINELIKKHSDEYLQFAGHLGENLTTKNMHSQIAKEIANTYAVKIGEGAYSENIHGGATKCAYWRRNDS